MRNLFNRRDFIKAVAVTGLGLSLQDLGFAITEKGKKVGIIGLDTSHSAAFAKVLNSDSLKPEFKGCRFIRY